MHSKYQIFVSSTYNDLKEQRDLVIKAILEMGHIPVGMEMFSAADEEQWSIIRRQIDQSDYYVVIVAHRYGSVADSGISYTEKEYDYAVSLGLPVLGFVIDEAASWPGKFTDTDINSVSALNQFKEKVKKKHVSFWNNTDDLYGKCSIALSKAFTAYPREGWVRVSQAPTDSRMTQELARLSAENAALRGELERYNKDEKEAHDKELRDVSTLLQNNKRRLSVWKKDAKNWTPLEDTTLYTVFSRLAPELMIDKSVADMSVFVAQVIAKMALRDIRLEFPVPSNSIKGWMADLATLELVRPSDKKRSVQDKNEYWTLTEKGKDLFRHIRRHTLENLAAADTAPDANSGSVDQARNIEAEKAAKAPAKVGRKQGTKVAGNRKT
jgi:hypothetical protein